MLYLKRYNRLIDHYKQNLAEGFVEKHHIIPKCMGGDDTISNLVILPSRAHFIAHYLLHKAYPENRSLAHAFAMMGVCNGFQHRSSKLYEKSKIARSKAMLGVPRPEWVKEKLRKPKSNTQNYKKPKSKEHSSNISRALVGKAKSKESIENSIQAKQQYFDKIKKKTKERKNIYRELFTQSALTRNEFFEAHKELSISTLKRYLIGL